MVVLLYFFEKFFEKVQLLLFSFFLFVFIWSTIRHLHTSKEQDG